MIVQRGIKLEINLSYRENIVYDLQHFLQPTEPSREDNKAAELTIEEHSAAFFSAALVPQDVQHLRSCLRAESLRKALSLRQQAEQVLSGLAAGVETLGDVDGVGDDVLLVPEAQIAETLCNVR